MRNRGTAVKLKKEGLLAGVSDLVIVRKNEITFVEIKTKKGRQQPNQKDFQREVEKLGFKYLIWRDIKDCHEWITSK